MSTSLRVEDKLDGASNFSPWKEQIMLILEVNDLLDLTKPIVTPPTVATQLAEHNKKDAKARILILDAVRDHIILQLSGKKSTKEMWEALTKLYQSDNHNKKMVMRDKLRVTKMFRIDIVATYLTRITQVSDELATIRETIDDHELVRTTLNGFTKSWDVSVARIVARENLPKWECMWDDFFQEEIQRD